MTSLSLSDRQTLVTSLTSLREMLALSRGPVDSLFCLVDEALRSECYSRMEAALAEYERLPLEERARISGFTTLD